MDAAHDYIILVLIERILNNPNIFIICYHKVPPGLSLACYIARYIL